MIMELNNSNGAFEGLNANGHATFLRFEPESDIEKVKGAANGLVKEVAKIFHHDTLRNDGSGGALNCLFRLFVKNGEYIYARANDIVMIESWDHVVKVYLVVDGKLKRSIRPSTLKGFLMQLPAAQFSRIGRFCAVNLFRLSGGNFDEQVFEFDFKVAVKLSHTLSHKVFANIGR